MKVQEIIAEQGILGSVLRPVLGGVVGAGAKALEPIATKQGAKAAAKAAKVAAWEKDLSTIGGVFGNWFSLIKNVALAWGILEPLYTTAKEIMALNAKLKNKQIEPDEYEGQVQFWLGKCVTQVAAIGAAKFSINTAGKLISTLPFSKTAGSLIAKLSGPGAAAFGVYLTTPDGSEAFWQWFVGNTFGKLVADFMRDWVGSWAKKGYDAVIGHEDSRTSPSASGSGNAAIDATSSLPTGSNSNPHGMEFDLGTGAWTNRPAR
jgi:hypothetical protein